jgi:uncharacterized protein YndB with AHSA1/START domain
VTEGECIAAGSRHISVRVDLPPPIVYAYAADPAHLPDWAAGLSTAVDPVGDHWEADSPMGRVRIDFAAGNQWGVLDHWVTLPSGEVAYNPMRVVAADGGSEVLFTVRRRPGMTDEDFDRDCAAVLHDLQTLRWRLEAR